MTTIVTLETDLAKNAFAVHGVNETGKGVPRVTSGHDRSLANDDCGDIGNNPAMGA